MTWAFLATGIVCLSIYLAGRPWNCAEAESMWREAYEEKENIWKEFHAGLKPKPRYDLIDADEKILDRFGKMQQKCDLPKQ